jgi:hypothetical protein
MSAADRYDIVVIGSGEAGAGQTGSGFRRSYVLSVFIERSAMPPRMMTAAIMATHNRAE